MGKKNGKATSKNKKQVKKVGKVKEAKKPTAPLLLQLAWDYRQQLRKMAEKLEDQGAKEAKKKKLFSELRGVDYADGALFHVAGLLYNASDDVWVNAIAVYATNHEEYDDKKNCSVITVAGFEFREKN